MAEKRIGFSGVDTGVSSMMAKLRESSKQLGNEMIADARKYSKQSKDQLGFLEDQIKALERRNKLERESRDFKAKSGFEGETLNSKLLANKDIFETKSLDNKLLREVIEAIKLTSKEEIAEDRKGVERQVKLFERDPSKFSSEDQLKLAYQKDLMTPEKTQTKNMAMSVFKGVMGAELVKGAIQTFREVPQIRSEIDAINPAVQLAGLGAGAVIGAGVGGVAGLAQTGLGGTAALRASMEGAGIGAKIGQDVAGVFAGYLQRQEQERAAIQSAVFSGRAMSGFSSTNPNFDQYGYSVADSANLSNQLAGARGMRRGRDVSSAIMLQRGAGVETGITSSLLGASRYSSDVFGGAGTLFAGRFQGRDRSGFSDAISGLTRLVQDFSQSSEKVNTQMAASTMLMFNGIGGGFDINDPRSVQRISQISNSLANPNNQLSAAENIGILRKMNPNAGIFDIMEMQSKGIQTKGFLAGKLKNISEAYGGDSQLAMTKLQKETGLGFEATRALYENREAIISGKGVGGQKTEEYLRSVLEKDAKGLTTDIDKSTAEISNAFATSMQSGIDTVEKYFGKAMTNVADMVQQYVEDKLGLTGESDTGYRNPYDGTDNPRPSNGRMF